MAPSLPNRSDAAVGQQHRHLQNGGTAARLRQHRDQAPARQPMERTLNARGRRQVLAMHASIAMATVL
jgi:hypothetical protein